MLQRLLTGSSVPLRMWGKGLKSLWKLLSLTPTVPLSPPLLPSPRRKSWEQSNSPGNGTPAQGHPTAEPKEPKPLCWGSSRCHAGHWPQPGSSTARPCLEVCKALAVGWDWALDIPALGWARCPGLCYMPVKICTPVTTQVNMCLVSYMIHVGSEVSGDFCIFKILPVFESIVQEHS